LLLYLTLFDVEFLSLEVGASNQTPINEVFPDSRTTVEIFAKALTGIGPEGIVVEDLIYQLSRLSGDKASGRGVELV
jgi:hypothetical protein